MQKPFDITCVILSGGKSQRMGEDKSLLPFGTHNSLIQFQYERLKPYFKDIYISSKNDKFSFLLDKKLILDKNQDIFSPILALQTIFETLKDEKVFIITVDTPFIKIETIKKLINESKNYDITIPKTQKTHNLCGVFSKNIKLAINQMINEDIHRIFYLIRNSNHKIIEFYFEEEFANINTQDDYLNSINYQKNL